MENGQIYKFNVIAISSAAKSPRATIFAQPNAFVAPPHPLHPMLFLHSINADATAWEETTAFLKHALGWTCGGTLFYRETDDPTVQQARDAYNALLPSEPPRPSPSACNQPFSPGKDFYVTNFGDNLANYTNDPDSRGRVPNGLQTPNSEPFIFFALDYWHSLRSA